MSKIQYNPDVQTRYEARQSQANALEQINFDCCELARRDSIKSALFIAAGILATFAGVYSLA